MDNNRIVAVNEELDNDFDILEYDFYDMIFTYFKILLGLLWVVFC